MADLLCTVRGCALPLLREQRVCRCARGHAFDIARSGYLNLLQPQDRRSRNPGDSKKSVEARRLLFERGFGADLSKSITASVANATGEPPKSILDVGCGEGTHVALLSNAFECEASGIDISTPAIELAAKRYPGITWVVANADRGLPFAGCSFDAVVSITSRRNATEFSRVLRPPGILVVAVPAPDDLIELRAALLGEAVERSRVDSVISDLNGWFGLEGRAESRERRPMSREELDAILLTTYRGGRRREMEIASSLEEMTCTFAYDVLVFRKRPAQDQVAS